MAPQQTEIPRPALTPGSDAPPPAAVAPSGAAPAAGGTSWVRSRHWTDWVGFVCILAFALRVALQSGRVGLMMIPAMLHDVLMAFLFLVRGRARRTGGLLPQAVAYGATYVFPLFIAAAAAWRPDWLAPVGSRGLFLAGISIWLFGSVVGLWPLWGLRTAFSIAPQARTLVTTGPYSLARHPIYATYLLQYGGIWLSHMTLPLTLAFGAWLALVLVRIRFEEQILTSVFPEYREYRQAVGAFGPRLTRATKAPAVQKI